jgi:hypothetical protein
MVEGAILVIVGAVADCLIVAGCSCIFQSRTSFGTRGSQVQILPLRPAFSP